jgi:hypothetical protein
LAACLPAPPPPPPPPTTTAALPPLATQSCLSQPPTSAAQYQQLFDLRNTIWDAADSTATISRPGRSTVWLFGDTYAGRVMPDGSLGTGWKFVNNSALTESGSCLTPHFGSTAPDPLFPRPGAGSWYWPGSGVVNADGTMQVILVETGPAGTDSFQPLGVAVATVGTDMSIQSVSTIPIDQLRGPNGLVPYGGSVTTDGTYAYLYGFAVPSFLQPEEYVARVHLSEGLTGTWEYSGCSAPVGDDQCPTRVWSAHPLDARPMTITDSAAHPADPMYNIPMAAFHVTAYNGGYLAVAKGWDIQTTGHPEFDMIYAWTSPTADGPWTAQGVIKGATLPSPNPGNESSYGARLIDTPNAGWLLTWNVNADESDVFANVHHYGPRFGVPSTLP